MKDNEKIILVGAGAVALVYFGLLNPVLKFLGIKESTETRELETASVSPNSFWNPNFWSLQEGATILRVAVAEQLAKDIWDAFGAFNDCEECVIGVFKTLRFQTQASFLAFTFQRMYGQDLLTFLRGGSWPQDRLSDADVSEINRFINNLPVK